MMMDGSAITTLILFLVSTIFVIHPISFDVPVYRQSYLKATLGLQSAPILAICILWASRCIGPAQIRVGIIGTDGVKPYNILILFISLAYMTITLDATGILKSAAFWVSNRGGRNGRKLFLYLYLLVAGLSMIIGNDPVTMSVTTFLIYYAGVQGLNPLPWLISGFAAANTASMVLFVGSLTNILICEALGVKNAAFTAYTILPFVSCCIARFGGLAFQFRKEAHIPKTLQAPCELAPLSILRDPVGAIVGSLVLVTCLVVVTALSYSRVDVCKIVLPFAIAKMIFDLAWDHYRYTIGRPTKPYSDKEMEVMIKRSIIRLMIRSIRVATDSPTASESAHGLQQQSQPESWYSFSKHFPTLFTALPRLPFRLIPFAFSQFILIESLSHQGWIDRFAQWLVNASQRKMIPTIWIIGILGVIMSNGGTNIGATILLTKVVRAAEMPPKTLRAAGIALAVASNIGAASFTASASLGGMLWDSILRENGVNAISQRQFAVWNSFPLLLTTVAGLAVVTAEMGLLGTS